MGVDFNAQPSPEGLLLAAQLRREQRQRDKALEDRNAEAKVQDAAASPAHQDVSAGPQTPVAEPETEAAAEHHDAAEPRDFVPAEPDSAPGRDTQPSFTAQLEALAAGSRPRRIDRQR